MIQIATAMQSVILASACQLKKSRPKQRAAQRKTSLVTFKQLKVPTTL
jgi:hypothetical protein